MNESRINLAMQAGKNDGRNGAEAFRALQLSTDYSPILGAFQSGKRLQLFSSSIIPYYWSLPYMIYGCAQGKAIVRYNR